MQNNSFVGRVLQTPTLIQKDELTYCKLNLIETFTRNDAQTKIDFIAYDEKAKLVVQKAEVGDCVSVTYIITNSSYEKDGVNYCGFSFTISSFEFCGPGKAKLARSRNAHNNIN